MRQLPVLIKGRGAQINPDNPFDSVTKDTENVFYHPDDDPMSLPQTKFQEVKPKSILNKVESPDVPGQWSLNPYQGCEHGCVYCYARNSHSFWGFSAGVDFESQIMIKRNAPDLLRRRLSSHKWEASPIMLSGNTDCYQPVERKEGITRKLLEIFWEFRHPVTIVTKNQLILRDLDILEKLASENLVQVDVSINTLEDNIRKKLEPRTSSIPNRLNTVRELCKAGIPVNGLAAPIIPSINDHGIMPLVKKLAELGVQDVNAIVVRLNGAVAEIFGDWVHKAYPDRATKVLHKIESMHYGKLNNSQFGDRMKGSGRIAEMIHQQMDLAKRLYLPKKKKVKLNTELYYKTRDPQISLAL